MTTGGDLHVVLDASGSMGEMGKLLLAGNVVSYMREKVYLDPAITLFDAIQLFVWNNEVVRVELSGDEETPRLQVEGKSNMGRLIGLLEDEVSDRQFLRVVILSDGNFPKPGLDELTAYLDKHPEIALHAVAIGVDASESSLKKLAGNGCVCVPEDIPQLIRSLRHGSEKDLSSAESLAELNIDSNGGGMEAGQ